MKGSINIPFGLAEEEGHVQVGRVVPAEADK
jgi:hypothetical protein